MKTRLALQYRPAALCCFLLVACSPSVAKRQEAMLRAAETGIAQNECDPVDSLRDEAASPDLDAGFQQVFKLLAYVCELQRVGDYITAYDVLQHYSDSLTAAGRTETPDWLIWSQRVLLPSVWASPAGLVGALNAGCAGFHPFPFPPWDGQASRVWGGDKSLEVPSDVRASSLFDARFVLCGDTVPGSLRTTGSCGPYAGPSYMIDEVRRSRQQVRFVLRDFRSGAAMADTVMWRTPPGCPRSLEYARVGVVGGILADERVYTEWVRGADEGGARAQYWLRGDVDLPALRQWVRTAVEHLDSAVPGRRPGG